MWIKIELNWIESGTVRARHCDSLVTNAIKKSGVNDQILKLNWSPVGDSPFLSSTSKENDIDCGWKVGFIPIDKINQIHDSCFDHQLDRHVWFSSFFILKHTKVNDPLTSKIFEFILRYLSSGHFQEVKNKRKFQLLKVRWAWKDGHVRKRCPSLGTKNSILMT